jgi:hypothetical protein
MAANVRPLSAAEHEYVINHPDLSLADLAASLDRPESGLTELLAASVKTGTKFRTVAKMTVSRKDAYGQNKRVGAIMTPQASQAMDEARKANTPTEPPPAHATNGKPTEHIFRPLGDS